MKQGSYLDLLLPISMLASTSCWDESKKNPITPSQLSGTIHKIVPKGCKEYFFDANGEYSTDGMRYDELVFKCIAINDKNAIKKFNKWKESTGALAD